MLSDLRLALRTLARTPGLVIAAVLSLAIGIAANTTVFTATNALALHPVPTPNSDRLVMLSERPPRESPTNEDFQSIAPANLLDWQRMSRTLESVAAFAWWDVNITGIDEPERVTGFRVAPEFFSVLGEHPTLGRPFTAEEGRTGKATSVILSAPLWMRRFAGDPSVVGRTVRLNGTSYTVVGVMAENFIFPAGAELWVPLVLDGTTANDRDGRWLNAIGRLRPGVPIEQARAEAAAIAKQLELQYPDMNAKWGMRVEPADRFYGRHPRQYLIVLLSAVAFVLLIACANVANLQLVRATSRGRELAVRVALGATRGTLLRQLFAESALVALASGALGVLLSLWGVVLFRATIPAELVRFNPGWTRIVVDGPTLLFSTLVSMATALLVGIAPAFVASRADPHLALQQGGGSRGSTHGRARMRLRGALVVAEVALALMLLAATGLMLRSAHGLVTADPGYAVDRALTLQVTLPRDRYDSTKTLVAFYHRLMDRVASIPGVGAVAVMNILPPAWDNATDRIYLEGTPKPKRGEYVPEVRARIVSSGYFDAMRIPVLRGRAFTRDDAEGRPHVAVISELLAQRFWPNADALGKRFTVLGDTTLTTVVGIARDIRFNPNSGSEPLGPTMYVPLEQFAWRTMSLVVRTQASPLSVARDVQRAVTALDPAMAAGDVLPLDHIMITSVSPQRITAMLLAVFSAIAVLLAGIGIYGVTSYAVAQRTHEIGIRVALGALQRDVVGHVLRQSMAPIALGVGLGLAGALAATRGLKTLLWDVSPSDPVTFGLVVGLLALVALLGSYLPARRAARVSPITALRAEG